MLERLGPVWHSLLLHLAPWLAVIALLAVLAYDRLLDDRLEPLRLAQSVIVSQGNTILGSSVDTLRRDVLLLSRSPAVPPAIESGRLDPLAAVFSLFAETSGSYDQIRWIDADGMERLRIDYRDGRARRVPDAALQDKSGRPYVAQGMGIEAGQVAFSRIDLNVEHGHIEQPEKPVLRVSTPLTDAAGTRRGILVLNVLAQPLLDEIAALPNRYGFAIHLLDNEGHWLMAPRQADRWAFMFGHPERTLARRHPRLWDAMQAQGTGSLQEAGGLWSFGELSLQPAGRAAGAGSDALVDRPVVRLAVQLPAETVQRMQREVLALTFGGALLALFAGAWLSARLVLSAHDRDAALASLRRRSDELHDSNDALREALERQQAMQDELVRAEKLSALGLMVAGVAHELNTPIGAAVVSASALQGQLDTLRQEIDRGLRRSALQRFLDDQEEGTQLVADNLARAAGLIRTFRQLAIDRGVMERRLFGLGEVIDALARTLKPLLQQAPQPLVIDVPAGIVLDSYPGPLGQVLENLVSNAYRHAFPDHRPGTVHLTASHAADAARGDQLVLQVRDDGCGIAPELLPQVFDPFTTTARNRGGTGLGLHLAHQLATEMLGGSLSVDSTPGQGTCFTLRMPVIAPGAEGT